MRLRGIKSKKLRRICESDSAGIAPSHLIRLSDLLLALRTATSVREIPESMKLHPLDNFKRRHLPPEKVVWAMKVTAQWRLTFRIDNLTIEDLDYVQYH